MTLHQDRDPMQSSGAATLDGRRATFGEPALQIAWRFRWLARAASCVATFIVVVGFPGSRPQMFAVVGVALIASGAASESGARWKRVVMDWFPFYVLLTLYDMLRGSAGTWLMPHAI